MEPPILAEFSELSKYPLLNASSQIRVAEQGVGRYFTKIEAGNNDAILIDWIGGYRSDQGSVKLVEPRKATNEQLFFSVSKMVIPPHCELVKEPVFFDRGRGKRSIDDFVKNRVKITEDNKLYLDVAHNFTPNEKQLHPCTDPSCIPESYSNLGDDKMLTQGAKACAYTMYSIDPVTLKLNAGYLHKSIADSETRIITRFSETYKLIKNPVLRKFGNSPVWKDLLLIPLQLPEGRIMYYTIPLTQKGKTELKDWEAKIRKKFQETGDPNCAVRIDESYDRIDAWDSDFTLDAVLVI
jgi:hypothetical protein